VDDLPDTDTRTHLNHVSRCSRTRCLVGGTAQWLGRRSLAGGLSLIYA